MEIIFVIYKSFFFPFLDVIILWTFLNIQKFKFTALIFMQQLIDAVKKRWGQAIT